MTLICFNSQTRTSGTSDDWTVNFATPIDVRAAAKVGRSAGDTREAIICLKLKSINIPDTFANIDATNNKIDFREVTDIADRTITMTPGYYTATHLMSHIITLLNAATGHANIYQSSISPTTGEVTIDSLATGSAGIAFTLRFLSGTNAALSPWRILGFTSTDGRTAIDTVSATSCLGERAINIVKYMSVYLKVEIDGHHMNELYDPASNSWVSIMIGMSSQNFDIIYYSDRSNMEQTLPIETPFISSIRFALCDATGKAISVNGSEWSLAFLLCGY